MSNLMHARSFVVCLCFTIISLTTLPRAAYTSEFMDDQTLAETYAPLVRLHPDEQFFPDSVENYLLSADPSGAFKNYVLSEGEDKPNLVQIDDLGPSPYSDPYTLPAYLQGSEYGVESNQVPIYSYIKEVAPDVTDILYVMYYPYNEGKKICEAMEVDINFEVSADTSITPEVKQTVPFTFDSSLLCLGSSIPLLDVYFASVDFTVGGVPTDLRDTTFGNHPTDAEYYMVRVENGQPTKILTGAHGKYVVDDWDNITKESDTHAVIYAGRGGHGTYSTSGKHRTLVKDENLDKSVSYSVGWSKLSLSASLSAGGSIKVYSIDHTADGGMQWRTWNNVETFKWESPNNVTGYPQYPWVAEYDTARWGSEEYGEQPSIEFGIDWSLGISKRYCLSYYFGKACHTLSVQKSGGADKTVTIADEKELTGTDGSVKIGRADNMFEEFDKNL